MDASQVGKPATWAIQPFQNDDLAEPSVGYDAA
jgi:hypothetical protein